MTYDMKRMILHTGVYEKVELTPKEHKMLICLSSGNLITYDELSRCLYGLDKGDKYTRKAIRVGITNLKKKTKKELIIKTLYGLGYRLENEIYFE